MIEWLHLLKIELLREGDLVILMHVNQKHYILCLMFSLSGHLIQKLFQNIFLAHEKNPYNFNYEKNFISLILPRHLDARIPLVDAPRLTRSPNSLDRMAQSLSYVIGPFCRAHRIWKA